MIALMRTLTVHEKSKITTEILGNRQGHNTGWLRDMINVRRHLQGKAPLIYINSCSDHLTIKSSSADMLIALFEGEKA